MDKLIYLVIILSSALITLVFYYYRQRDKLSNVIRIHEISRKLSSNIKLRSLMKDIMETIKEETMAEACTLYLVDEGSKELWFDVVLGYKSEQVKELRLKIGEGIAGWVAQQGVSLNIKDVNKDERFRRDISEKIGHKQKSMLTMPVKYKDSVVGVIQVINKLNNRVFTKRDEDLIDALCGQISIALDNARLYNQLNEQFYDTVKVLSNAIDAKDKYTIGHSKRVTEISLKIGKEMGLSSKELESLELMGLLHDVGKIGIGDAILNKPGKLNEEEFEIIKTHTQIGSKILNTTKTLGTLSVGAEFHHEKFDGSGYCHRLMGESIPLYARIIAVADAYDAMTSDRVYRKGLSHEIAIKEINNCSGTQFDPYIIGYFNKVAQREYL